MAVPLVIQALMDSRPDFAFLSVDIKNAYNEEQCAALLTSLWKEEALRPIYAMFHRLLSVKSPIHVGSGCSLASAAFASKEGFQQGDVFGSFGYCLGANACNNALDTILKEGSRVLLCGMRASSPLP